MQEDEPVPNVHTDEPVDSEQEPAPTDPATPDVAPYRDESVPL